MSQISLITSLWCFIDIPDQSRNHIVPTFVTPLKNQTVTAGQPLILRVRASGFPTPSLKWWRGETEINSSDAHFSTSNDGHGGSVLTVKRAEPEDADLYRCVAANAAGEASTEGNVSVEGKPASSGEAPYFTKKIRDVTVNEGEAVNLSCTFSGQPAPIVKWFLNDKLVQTNKDVVITSDSSTSLLEIASALPEDTGVYTVEISNSAGHARCFAGINVTRAPTQRKSQGVAPRFVRRFVDTEASLNYDVHFECQVTGEPTPVVKWYHERKEITSQMTQKYELVHKERIGWSRLVVRNVTADSIGQYTAVATNDDGEASCSAYLNVVEAKLPHKGDKDGSTRAEMKPPAFARPLRDTEVVEREKTRLDCKLTEPMEVQVKWFKDGMELYDGPKYHMENLPDGTLALNIKEVKKRDGGRYSCIVSNEAGRAKTNCELKVDVPKDDDSRRDDGELRGRKRVAGRAS